MNVIPPFLKTGDTIAIVATARWVTPDQLMPACKMLESWGFKLKIGKNVCTQHFQLAGTDEERTEDLQEALDDPEVKAVLVARGGYGTVRVLDKINFSGFMQNPKWICGYSDITVLHAYLNSRGVATIHSTMPISFPDATSEALENLRLALRGELKSIPLNLRNESGVGNDVQSVPILGGNLSVLFSLLGSETWRPKSGYFLFLEDVDEMLYHVDRMMEGMSRSGAISGASAIILGGMTQMKDNTKEFGFATDNPWGFSAEETVMRIAKRHKIPIYFGLPAGHLSDNRAFYLGLDANVKIDAESASISFQQ